MSNVHKTTGSLARALHDLAERLELISAPIADTYLGIHLQVVAAPYSGSTDQERADAVELLQLALGCNAPTYSRGGLYRTGGTYLDGATVDVFGGMDPPAYLVDAAHAEALAEDAARSEQPDPGPELAMYDNVYAGWPA